MNIARVVVSCLALLVLGARAQAVNLVANGGFETGTFSGWSTVPAGAGSLFQVISGGYTGAFSARFGATAGQHDQIFQNIMTTPGTAYTLTFWVFNAGGGGDSLLVQWNGVTVVNETAVGSPNIWRQVSVVVGATGTTSELRFAAYDQPSFVYIDDIVLESGNLITNPGFETGDFTGWNTLDAPSGTLYDVVSEGHSGGFSAGFAAVGGQNDQIWQNIPTTPGRVYILQFWLRSLSAGGDNLQVFWDGAQVYALSPVPFTAGGWTFKTFVLTADSANTELRFGGYDGPDAVYLDDLYLAEPTVGLCLIPGDADRSGAVNFADITKVLENWGFICAP